MAGETDAQQRLIELHLADVAEIAKLYAGQGVLLEDLVGEGNLALSFGVTMLGSLEKPDEVEGMLGKMIMDAMEEYIAEHAENSKIDKRVEDKVNKVADKARELAEELHRKGDHGGTDGRDRYVPQDDRGCHKNERFQD